MLDFGTLNHDAALTLSWLVGTSLWASGIALLTVAIQFLFGRRLTPGGRYCLWSILIVRLLIPTLPSSRASIANLDLSHRGQTLWAWIANSQGPESMPVRQAGFPRTNLPDLVPTKQLAVTDGTGGGVTVSVVKEPLGTASRDSAPLRPAPRIVDPPRASVIPLALMAGWAIVAVFMSVRLAIGNVALAVSLKRAAQVSNPNILSLLQKCGREMGLKTAPDLLITSAVRTPAAAGVFTPSILFPPALLESLSAAELRTVLLHELAHIRGRDVAANWLLALIQIVHWFNPVLWFAFARLRADREVARDAMVVSLSGDNNAHDYVHTLLKLTEFVATPRFIAFLRAPGAQGAVGMYGGKRGLKRRLQMITQFSQSRRRIQWTAPVLAVLMAGTLLTSAQSQSQAGHPQVPSTRPADVAKSPDHLIEVPLFSEMPIVGQLFTSQVQSPTSRPSSEKWRIPYLILQARSCTEGHKYSEALAQVNDILKIDPTNEFAVGVKPLLDDKVQYDIQRQFIDQRQTIKTSTQPTAPTTDVLRYPTDWAPADINNNNGKPASQPRERQAELQLDRMLPSLQFDAVGFSDVVDFLRDISSANIFVNWKSLEAAGIDRNTPVSANLRNVKFSKALSVILEFVGGGQVRLAYAVDDGVITISTKDDLSKNVVVRVYDIRDLLISIPEIASPGSPAPVPATRPVSRDEVVGSFTTLIMETVDTTSWKRRGGSVGALRELEGQLIVTQTLANHRQIVRLLDSIREGRSLQVSVEARYISCDPKSIRDLMSQWKRSAAPPVLVDAKPATRPAGSSPGESKFDDVFLGPEQVSQLMKLCQNSPESTIITSPRITLFSGQRAYVKVASSRAYLGGYTPTTRGDGEVRYEPVVKSVETGVTMNVTATVSNDRKSATVAIRPTVSTFLGFTRVPWAGSPRNVELMVQEPRVKTSELQTTVTIPDGGSVLLGGLEDPGLGSASSTFESPSTHPASSSRGLYLLLRPTVIRNTIVQEKPSSGPAPK